MGFGMVHIHAEGCPVHPDELDFADDEDYNKQLKAYYDCFPHVKKYATEYELKLLQEI